MNLTQNLEGCRIGNVFHLEGYPHITDPELDMLGEFPWSELHLDCTHIDDERLRRLHPPHSRRRNVAAFAIWKGEKLSDDSIEFVSRAFNTVQALFLEGCQRWTDDGVALCSDVAGLAELTLDNWITDGTGLDYLKRLRTLKSLGVVNHSNFDSENLRRLQGTRVRALCLLGTSCKPQHLLHLCQINGLVDLDLTSTGFGDEGLEAISSMARLESLKFEDATVTDGGFVRLATLPQLKQLIACCPGVTDQGAQTVLQLPSLQKLRFTNALITDQTVSLLPGLNQLVWLALHGCKGVTDAAEKALAKMTRLKRLSLRSTSITPNVAERLRLALPDCEVKFHAGPF